MAVITANVLVAGIANKSMALTELPVRLLVADTGTQAVQCMKRERIHTLISHWNLIDAPHGELFDKVIAARPFMPTIAFIRPGDEAEEIAARSYGVSAVLSEDAGDEYFRDTVCQLLGISTIVSMKIADEDIGQSDERFDFDSIAP